MKNRSTTKFSTNILEKGIRNPLTGHVELTYRCPLKCRHCYCIGSEDKEKELTTHEWKKILDTIHAEGCLWLIFTGGDPLIRNEFSEIYFYAKSKGFIITVFTSGQILTDEILNLLTESPPFSIEITLNGITKEVYEKITGVKDSFPVVIKNIERLVERKLPLNLKTNCLKENMHQVGQIKAFTETLLGNPSENKHFFTYDVMIYPRLTGNQKPCESRLSYKEILDIEKQDKEMWKETLETLQNEYPKMERERCYTYQCNSWLNRFWIDPYGFVKICEFENRYKTHFKTKPFNEIFHNEFPKVLDEKFKTNSKCQDCKLRSICNYCPPKAVMETGNHEGPVPYYCELAEDTLKAVNEAKKFR